MSNLRFLPDGSFVLSGVRLSYPNLFKPYSKGGKEGKYSAKLLLPKTTHKVEANTLYAKIVELARTELKGDLAADRYCLRNGDPLGKPEYMGNYVLSTSEKDPPGIRDAMNRPVTEAQDIIYAGCYVNLLGRIWAQNNVEYGKRINCNLLGVQFAAPGERFGHDRPDLDEVFTGVQGEFGAGGTVAGLDDGLN